MRDNFSACLDLLLASEGGFVDHPRDPGGATNFGITHRVYDAYRRRKGLATRSVKQITTGEVTDIYRSQYWHPVRADELPLGVDYAVFDFAVNSGVSRSSRYVQRIVEVEEDGHIGVVTLGAIDAFDHRNLINRLMHDRLEFLKGLDTWEVFGKGWQNRVDRVRGDALEMLPEPEPEPVKPLTPPPPDGLVARTIYVDPGEWAAK